MVNGPRKAVKIAQGGTNLLLSLENTGFFLAEIQRKRREIASQSGSAISLPTIRRCFGQLGGSCRRLAQVPPPASRPYRPPYNLRANSSTKLANNKRRQHVLRGDCGLASLFSRCRRTGLRPNCVVSRRGTWKPALTKPLDFSGSAKNLCYRTMWLLSYASF